MKKAGRPIPTKQLTFTNLAPWGLKQDASEASALPHQARVNDSSPSQLLEQGSFRDSPFHDSFQTSCDQRKLESFVVQEVAQRTDQKPQTAITAKNEAMAAKKADEVVKVNNNKCLIEELNGEDAVFEPWFGIVTGLQESSHATTSDEGDGRSPHAPKEDPGLNGWTQNSFY